MIFSITAATQTQFQCVKSMSCSRQRRTGQEKFCFWKPAKSSPVPQLYRKMVQTLKKTGIFEVISGIICGKPMDELYFEEYKKILVEEVADPTLPIVANVNIGHATPRCIIPFGVDAVVDANRQQITFSYEDK